MNKSEHYGVGLTLTQFVRKQPVGTQFIYRCTKKNLLHYTVLHTKFTKGNKSNINNNPWFYDDHKNQKITYCTKRRGKYYFELED